MEFHEGINVLIGHNNAGKSNLLRAMQLVLEPHCRCHRLQTSDFCKNTKLEVLKSHSPKVEIPVVLAKSKEDEQVDDLRIVANWLIKMDTNNSKKNFDLLAKLDVDIKDAVVIIQSLLSSYDDISKMSLYEFYDYLNITFGLSMSTLKKGQAQTFYNSHQYSQLAMCVNHEDDDGIQRTIHKAKGDEFDNVMVCLSDEKALDFFLQPDLLKNESHRVYYVAASRAKERLFFSIPLLSDGIRKKIEKLGIEIK